MNFKKFAADIDSKIQEQQKARADVQAKLDTAQAAADEAAALKDQAAQAEDLDAFTAAEAKEARAAAALEMYGRKLEAMPEKVFTFDEVIAAQEQLSAAYEQKQQAIEERMKAGLQDLQKKLLPLMQEFEKERAAGNAAIDRMKANSETVWQGSDRRTDNVHGYYNADSDNTQKLLTVAEAILNGKKYVKVEF